jgi:hypothetical protein
VSQPRLAWYARRLRGMSPAEVAWRLQDRVRQEAWAHRTFGPATTPSRSGPRAVPPGIVADLATLPEEWRMALLSVARELLEGRAEILGVTRHDMVDPDWSLDPISGRRYPVDRLAFRIDYRSPGDRRNVKQVWELSRHHHVTVLACAWRLTGDERYAAMAADHLRSWWQQNPVLSGVNWSSGIELGIRLISWVWTRRLLEGWSGAPALFEDNDVAARQIYWHQRYLAAFRGRGSSANNHVVAEAAGQLVTSCALPWFAESDRWRDDARRLLEDELAANVFPDGLDREQAFEYHGLVAELGLVAAAEAEAGGTPVGPTTWARLCRMVDVTAAVVDQAGRPPRYGDGDDGRALVLADPAADRWASLLALGAALFGPRPWWPPTRPDAQSMLVAGLAGRTIDVGPRPDLRPSHFPDAGLTLLRSPVGGAGEIWCRCDSGPHGFLSIAAHAHADALSVELRHQGTEILVDPGTYCYHGDPTWRRYFRSSLGHNTLEIDGRDQSEPGGPFLWTSRATTRLLEVSLGHRGVQRWSAEHDGYERLDPPATHRRTVTLDPDARSLEIVDDVSSEGAHDLRLAFHLGPSVEATVTGQQAELRWARRPGGEGTATLRLPEQLSWETYRGSTDPVLGWYSTGFGRRSPTTTLVGTGSAATTVLRSEIRFTS